MCVCGRLRPLSLSLFISRAKGREYEPSEVKGRFGLCAVYYIEVDLSLIRASCCKLLTCGWMVFSKRTSFEVENM